MQKVPRIQGEQGLGSGAEASVTGIPVFHVRKSGAVLLNEDLV